MSENKLIENPDPTWFTTGLTGEPGERVYPFFGTEDGDLIGLGHQDATEFAQAAIDYWRATESGDPDIMDGELNDLAAQVEHRWNLVREGDPDGDYGFWIDGYDLSDPDHPRVTAETPGAVAITTLQF